MFIYKLLFRFSSFLYTWNTFIFSVLKLMTFRLKNFIIYYYLFVVYLLLSFLILSFFVLLFYIFIFYIIYCFLIDSIPVYSKLFCLLCFLFDYFMFFKRNVFLFVIAVSPFLVLLLLFCSYTMFIL